jgi:endoribonuclease LACTB2
MNIVNVGYRSTNYYVVGQGDARMLVDAGWPGTLPTLLAELRRKDIALQAIQHVLVTHYHPDHAGLAQELKNKGLRLIVLEQQIPAIPLLKAMTKPSDRYVDIALHDNVQLTIGESRAFLTRINIAGEIVATPGHSDDSVTLVLDDGAAFTGDLTWPDFADAAAHDTILHSWQAIRALRATTVYPGHGPARPLP